ncbi:hypothetical protein [Aeromicrobium sp. NPDC092404]|uniref:hypothetical protein n=1 Tax=Aeromicrobium sp. NPDC092404 TaxID=3154976 RepID=UPI0034404B29
MKRSLLAVGAAVGAITVVGATVAVSEVIVSPAHDVQDQLIHRGGVVRLGKVVSLHTNPSHASVGLTATELVRGCYLRVLFDTAPGEQIVSIEVDEDETLSKLGIVAGASGGNGYANVYLYRNGRPVCANNVTLPPSANLWFHVMNLAPKKTDVEELEPAPAPTPPLEPQQRTVPQDARATITPAPAG